MVLYVKHDGEIWGYNNNLTTEQETLEIKKDIAVEYDGDFSWDTGDEKSGYTKKFYLENDHTIRIEYVQTPTEDNVSQLDRIESAVSNTLDEIRAEAVDEYTLSLMENNII